MPAKKQFSNPEFMYIVCDSTNLNAILLSTGSESSAKAITLSDRRLKIFPIETWANWIDENFSNFNFNDLNKTYLYSWRLGKRLVVEADAALSTDRNLIDFRKEVKSRFVWHDALDILCNLVMCSNTETPLHSKYGDSIIGQLQQCDISNNYFTDAIIAYATATNCTPATAYEELKLHMENMAHVRLRNLGIYIKHRNLLNSVEPTNAALKEVYDSAKDELIMNSLV
jgi:hypothetical protein